MFHIPTCRLLMYSILIEGKWVLWRETELFLKYLVFTLKEISHAEDIFLAEQRERERERERNVIESQVYVY